MKKALYLIPTFILILIATNQFYMTRQHNLTPWKGGGFGMFSTIDSMRARNLKVFIKQGLHKKQLNTSERLTKLIGKFETIPSLQLKQEIVDYLNSSFFYESSGENDEIIISDYSDVSSTEIKSPLKVSIEFWRYKFNRNNNSLNSQLVWVEEVN